MSRGKNAAFGSLAAKAKNNLKHAPKPKPSINAAIGAGGTAKSTLAAVAASTISVTGHEDHKRGTQQDDPLAPQPPPDHR